MLAMPCLVLPEIIRARLTRTLIILRSSKSFSITRWGCAWYYALLFKFDLIGTLFLLSHYCGTPRYHQWESVVPIHRAIMIWLTALWSVLSPFINIVLALLSSVFPPSDYFVYHQIRSSIIHSFSDWNSYYFTTEFFGNSTSYSCS